MWIAPVLLGAVGYFTAATDLSVALGVPSYVFSFIVFLVLSYILGKRTPYFNWLTVFWILVPAIGLTAAGVFMKGIGGMTADLVFASLLSLIPCAGGAIVGLYIGIVTTRRY